MDYLSELKDEYSQVETLLCDVGNPDEVQKAMKHIEAQHPVGKVGKVEDIAEMVWFLLSDKAAFITGQNIVVDGGMTKKMIYV